MSTTSPLAQAMLEADENDDAAAAHRAAEMIRDIADAPLELPEDPPAHPDPDSVEDEPAAEEPVDEHDSQLDDLELQMATREWTVEGKIQIQGRRGDIEEREWKKTYTQKPLSFAAMLQFTGLIGDRLSQAMSGPDGLTVDGIIGENDLVGIGRNVLSRQDFTGVDAFVKGLAKLAMYVPDVVEDCQCIWLRIPFNERPIVKEIWMRAPEDGGLSMDDGETMLEIFLAQNYREVEDFFVGRLPRLAKKLQNLRARIAAQSPRSNRSKLIAADTQSQ